jgi:hypothetical protein
MGGENFGHAVELVEAPYREILDKARAIDAAELLVSFLVGLKCWPAAFHVSQPKDVRALDDHAIGPDFEAAVELDGLLDDEEVNRADDDQTQKVEPERMRGVRPRRRECASARKFAGDVAWRIESIIARVRSRKGRPDHAEGRLLALRSLEDEDEGQSKNGDPAKSKRRLARD